MAKIEAVQTNMKKTKKRKMKEEDPRAFESQSPSSKFKKLDISQIGAKKTERSSQSADRPSSSPAKSKTAPSTQKRKSKVASNGVKVKKAKTVVNTDSDHENDDEPHDPSNTELVLATQPENTPNIDTTRQKKRAKHQKVVETAKVDSAQREVLRNLEYLRKWKTNKTEWKFEKLRQISIQNQMFSEKEAIDDESWELAIEYMSGTKGAGREVIIKKAEEIINEIDSRISGEKNTELVKLQSYNRARELLQLLQ